MTGYRFLAEALQAYGVTHLFFVPTIVLPAMAEMENMGITRVVTHGEKAAAYMADGYARATRKPGVCLAQQVGAANLAAGLRDARMACSPIIAFSGGPDVGARYSHSYQYVDDLSMFDPVTKFNAVVERAEDLPGLLRQAFREATTGAPGPVHLQLPGRAGEVLAGETNARVAADATFGQCPPFRPPAELDAVRLALDSIHQARRPVIVAGGGVAWSDAAAEVVALAEALHIPVATSLNGKGTIPERHPLAVGVVGSYSRQCANQVVARSDLVIYIGSHTGSQVTNNWKVPPQGTPVVQIDIDPAEIGRTYAVKAGLVGDAKAVCRQLLQLIEGGYRPSRTAADTGPAYQGRASERNGDWVSQAQEVVEAWRDEIKAFTESDAQPMRPERICREIAETLPERAVVVSDTGHSGIWTGSTLDITKAGQRYIRCAGSLGWGFPASLGVKCALPDRPVICFTGDGGLLYHLAELETAARYGINAVIVVNNNHSLNQETKLFDRAYGGQQRGRARDMWVFKETNYARLAEELGCAGIRVERPSELRDALRRGLAAERPVVIDAVSDIEAVAPPAWG